MEDLNSKFKEEVNKRFEELFRKIGNNRQQLSNKVIGVQGEIIKELNKGKVETARQQEILREVSATEKMAAKQLPHLSHVPVRPPAPPSEKKPAAVSEKKAAPVQEKKSAPAPEKKTAEKKPVTTAEKKKAAPAKKAPAKKSSGKK